MWFELLLFDPSFVADAHPVCEDIKELRILLFYTSDSTIDNLKREMPMYAGEAEDVSAQIDRTDWWGKNPRQTPRMVKCVHESTLTSAFICRI